MPADVLGIGFRGALSHRLRGAVPLAAERQEELPECYISQLAARVQRGPDDVLHSNGMYCITCKQNLANAGK